MLEVEIEKLLNNGSGLARDVDGRVIFVPQTLPGERVRLDQVSSKKGIQIAESYSLVRAAPSRQEPSCPHYERCGGCDLLHAECTAELELKRSILIDVLQRVGKMEDPQVRISDFALEASRHRGKLTLDRKGTLGFLERGSKRVSAFGQCLVVPYKVKVEATKLATLLHRQAWFGEVWFLLDQTGSKVAFEWETRRRLTPPQQKALRDLASPTVGLRVLGHHKRVLLEAGPAQLRIDWNGHVVSLCPAQFMQTNPKAWPLFWREVADWSRTHQIQSVWDAHAGSGFLASCIPATTLYASEPDKRGVANLKRLPHAEKTVFQGTAEAFIAHSSDQLQTVDGVVLDPPRAGLSAQLKQWLNQSGPDHALYFSCDMATFARDLKDLAGHYQVGSIHAFNMSPGTLKLEMVTQLRRRSGDV